MADGAGVTCVTNGHTQSLAQESTIHRIKAVEQQQQMNNNHQEFSIFFKQKKSKQRDSRNYSNSVL